MYFISGQAGNTSFRLSLSLVPVDLKSIEIDSIRVEIVFNLHRRRKVVAAVSPHSCSLM